MAAILGEVDADAGPSMTIPLRHFLVGLGFLVVGTLVGTGASDGGWLVHVHLLLVGWVCITIMGAMTQFVPVWSGTILHSRRLATLQLWLVVAGLVLFAGGLLADRFWILPFGGGLLLTGFWVFVYNVGRTLLGVQPWDVTERHFAIALGFFLVLTTFGVLLATSLSRPILAPLPVDHGAVRASHATVAIFGAVLTTVFGALYQLATMFTQSELHGIDHWLRRIEEISYPVGVVLLAGGRLFEVTPAGQLGGALVVTGVLAVGIVLCRRLYETQVGWTPMLRRYVVVAVAMIAWALVAAPVWLSDPLSGEVLYGAAGTVHLLAIGVIGFVVFGSLYHIVPFIVWVHRYSDQLGLADVPMIDDLYDSRLAAADFGLLLSGTVLLIGADLLDIGLASTAGRALVALGAMVFAGNLLLVLRQHSPHTLSAILFGRFSSESLTPERDPDPVGDR